MLPGLQVLASNFVNGNRAQRRYRWADIGVEGQCVGQSEPSGSPNNWAAWSST